MLNPFALRQSGESIEAFKLLSTKGKQINKRKTEEQEGGNGHREMANKCVYKCRRFAEQQAAASVVGVYIASQMTHGNQKET